MTEDNRMPIDAPATPSALAGAPRNRRVGRPAPPPAQAATLAAGRVETREPIRAEPARDPLRTRKRKGGNQDDFYIPPEMIPPGSTYEWKRATVYGQSDPGYDVALRENGWQPVDVSLHPEFMPRGHTGAITRKGMILMERPTYLTAEARAEDDMAARELIRAKEQQLGNTPSGQLPREHPTARPSIKRGYAPIEIPGDS